MSRPYGRFRRHSKRGRERAPALMFFEEWVGGDDVPGWDPGGGAP